jgi:hypothetical protein
MIRSVTQKFPSSHRTTCFQAFYNIQQSQSYNMSQAAGRAAMQAGKAATGNVLNKGAKRDPELYVWTLNPIPCLPHPKQLLCVLVGFANWRANILFYL